MKVTLQAKPLTTALGLAAGMLDAKMKRLAALGHARLTAEGDRLAVVANVLDFELKLSLPAVIEAAGEVAIRSEQLAALAAGFPGDAEITISSDETMASIICGCSAALLEITSTKFTFISKLIDADYPAYERLVSASTDNTAIVDRGALVQAVARVAAVVSDDRRLPLVGVTWQAPERTLQLCVPDAPDIADDPVEVEMSGSGRFAVQVHHLAQLLNEIGSDRVRIDAGVCAGSAVLITDPDDANFTILQMPCAWGAEASQAA